MARKTVFIVNPESRAGVTDRLWYERENILRSQGLDPEVRRTTGIGHATQLTAQALRDGYDHIIAVGGDGTINEVVNGFFADGALIAPHACLSALSFSTGGDLARILPLEGEPEDIAALLSDRARPFHCDLVRTDYTAWDGSPATRYFINVSDVGIGCETVLRVNNRSKRMGGVVSFLGSALAALLTARSIDLEIITDGAVFHQGPVNMAVVANGRYFGSGMYACPIAEPDDGLLDVVVYKGFSRPRMLLSVPQIYSGSVMNNPRVSHCKAQTVEFNCAAPFPFEVDGETPGFGSVKFQILPGAMPMLLSRERD